MVNIYVTAQNSTCNGGRSGSLKLSADGGSGGGYSYSVNSGTYDTATEIDSLGPGVYSVAAKDSAGCISLSYVATLTDPSGKSRNVSILMLTAYFRCNVASYPHQHLMFRWNIRIFGLVCSWRNWKWLYFHR